ncbi:hypothetical protein [Mannheimia indoligenes]
MKANQQNLNHAVKFLKKLGFMDEEREITELSVSSLGGNHSIRN